ncbi:MAG: AAA family ATPase [Thermoproteus sp.]
MSTDLVYKFFQLYSEASEVIYQPRNSWGAHEMALGAVLGIISDIPVFYYGPPGTGKTTMVERIARALRERFRYYLLTKFTEPDEIFGVADLAAIRQGKYRRVTKGTALDAGVVFFDEFFNASSAILNTLLGVLWNRVFINGDEVVKVDWLGVFGASNRVPDEEELQALYDRFGIRVFVGRVLDVRALWRDERNISVAITREEVEQMRQKVREVERRGRVDFDKINAAVNKLDQMGIYVSPRRLVFARRVAAAIAALFGEDSFTTEDVLDAFVFVIPNRPEDVSKVREVVEEQVKSTPSMQQLLSMIQSLDAIERDLDLLPPQNVERELGEIRRKATQTFSSRREKAALATLYQKIDAIEKKLKQKKEGKTQTK